MCMGARVPGRGGARMQRVDKFEIATIEKYIHHTHETNIVYDICESKKYIPFNTKILQNL